MTNSERDRREAADKHEEDRKEAFERRELAESHFAWCSDEDYESLTTEPNPYRENKS